MPLPAIEAFFAAQALHAAAGCTPLAPPPGHAVLDLEALVAAALRRGAPLHGSAIVACRLAAAPVLASAEQIACVLQHLVANALEATRDCGRPAIVRIDAQPGAGRVLLRVSDNGHGLAPAVQARLFEPFFTTHRPERGYGLGLTLARAIVQAHGGSLAAANRRPHGACFAFDLPAAAGAPLRRPDPAVSTLLLPLPPAAPATDRERPVS